MQITKDAPRIIVEEFTKEIKKCAAAGPKPESAVIDFRHDKSAGITRPIVYVPIELLRYRKDNGRIASDVLSYERENNILDETQKETQELLRKFLYDKDVENRDVLIKAIRHDGQNDPAIITCDGFLINGNRRKMVFEELIKENSQKYSAMKVVILPDGETHGDPAPTIREIEIIENKYQLSRDGKSDYTGLDRALSIQRKIDTGISLDEQLQADPESGGDINSREFIKMKKHWTKNFINPLIQVDAYLENIGRPGHYQSADGRWQSFIDFSDFYNGDLQSESWRLKHGIDEDEIGKIQEVAFKIIRLQSIPGKPTVKNHEVIRKLKKFLEDPYSRKTLYSTINNSVELSQSETLDNSGKEIPLKEQDSRWSSKKQNQQVFGSAINIAYDRFDKKQENESSMNLMNAIIGKIRHQNMDVNNIVAGDLEEFVKLAEQAIDEIKDLKKNAWDRLKLRK